MRYKIYKFNSNFDLYIKNNRLYTKSIYGFTILKLPTLYFFKEEAAKIFFLFLTKFSFISFKKHTLTLYKQISNIYTIRIKIKGLGNRFRKITDSLYYFYFTYTNMYYFYLPHNILIKWYKKRIILISNNHQLLKSLLTHILLLKKLGGYRLRGMRYPRQIILLKKTKKKF